MNAIKIILTIILMFVLRNLYHKMFRVVYFDAVTAIFREFAICFLLAGIIVFVGFSKIESLFMPMEKDPGFYGTYYNLSLLEGGEAEVYIQISDSGDSKDRKMRISGMASSVASTNFQRLTGGTVEIPDGNTFTYTDETRKITLTITADSKNHTLEVIEESGTDTIPLWFSGKYIDQDAWEQLGDEIEVAKAKAVTAQTPNKWLANYFDDYTLRSYAVGEKGSHLARFSIHEYPDNGKYFTFDYYAEENGTRYTEILTLPYPLGDVEPGRLAYKTEAGLIAFEVQENSSSGKTEFVVTDFPYSAVIGTYIPSGNLLDESDMPEAGRRLWDGVYTCASYGSDGTKTLTITQTADSTLLVNMYHLYANGREESLDIVANIGTDNHGPYFASYYGDRKTFFTLSDDCSTIEVSQLGVYPAVDKEFMGTYTLTSMSPLENIPDSQSSDTVVSEGNNPLDNTPPISAPDNSSSDDVDDDPVYTDIPEELSDYLPEDEPWSWDGVYTCASDGPDGTKTLTITQTSDSTLSINLYHLYADGREDTLDIIADIGTYNHGQYFASYTDDKILYFELTDDSTVNVIHIGVYPDIDLEFFGTYTSEN